MEDSDKGDLLSICLEDLPDELLCKALMFTEFAPSAYLVCHKWRQVMLAPGFDRQACFDRWSEDICVWDYDKKSESDKKKLLAEYLIPLANDGNVDWKRYYMMRSNYEQALKLFFPYKQKSDLKKDRIKYALKVIQSGLLPKMYEHSLVSTVLVRDIGLICLEQSEDHEKFFRLYSLHIFPEQTILTKEQNAADQRLNAKICKALLEYYQGAKLHNSPIQKELLPFIVSQFLHFIPINVNGNWDFQEYRNKVTSLSGMVQRDLESNPAKESKFIEWLSGTFLHNYSPDLWYPQVFESFCNVANNDQYESAAKAIFGLIYQDRDRLHSPSHLTLVVNFILAAGANFRIDPNIFKTFASLGDLFKPFIFDSTEKFCNKLLWTNTQNYLEFTLLKAHPSEAQKMVIEMIEKQAEHIFWILGESFNLIRQSLGDKWIDYRFRIVDMMLDLFPTEIRHMKLTLGDDIDSSAVKIENIPAVNLDTKQFNCLSLLMTLPKIYPPETQHQILNVAITQLNNSSKWEKMQSKILKMHYMKEINDDTLPYFVALLTLTASSVPSPGMVEVNVAEVIIKLIAKYPSSTPDIPSRALTCIQPFASKVLKDVVACAHLAYNYSIKALKEACSAAIVVDGVTTYIDIHDWTTKVQGLINQGKSYLQTAKDTEHYDVVLCFTLLLMTSNVDPQIEQFTGHNCDWSVVLAALNDSLVQEQIGEAIVPLIEKFLHHVVN